MDKIIFNIIIVNFSNSKEKIDWLFKTIKDTNIYTYSLEEFKKKKIDNSSNTLLIFNLSLFEDDTLIYFKDLAEKISPENCFFIVTEKTAKQLALLGRIGFQKFYIYPDDEFILRNDVIDFIEKIKKQLNFEENLKKIHKRYSFDNLIGRSPIFLECVEIAKKVAAKSDTNVLLLGETGTGKELFAKAIHYNSDRAEYPFIELNTSAITETLFESELFGYEKGAFTDAKSSKPGLLEIAEKGTTFLDEIGDLNLNLQVKLLRAIENKSIKRVGGLTDISIDCRIIAATNQNLEKLIEEKKFRHDLYYRLKVISIHLPPLRERKEDILLLADHFITVFNHKYDKKVEGLTQKAKQLLLQYNWPGNIRELSNLIERAVLLSEAKLITEHEIQKGLSPIISLSKKNLIELKIELDNSNIDYVTRELANEVLKRVGGNKSIAAKLLGISRPKLLKLLNEKN